MVYRGAVAKVDQSTPSAESLGSRLEFETLISDLSSRFINLAPDAVDREIEEALRQVCESLGIDLAVLWQWSDTPPGVFEPTHTYSALPGQRPSEVMRQEQFPWIQRQMVAGRLVAIASLEELPAEAAVDREQAGLLGIKSNLSLPLSVGGEGPVGILGFSTMRAQRDWPDPVVARLRLVTQVFANALARKRADEAFRDSEEVNRATFDQAAVGIAHVATDGRWLRINDKLCTILGYPRDELLGMSFQDITHPDDLEADLGLVRQVVSGDIKTYSMEKRYVRKDGSLIWCDLTVSSTRTAAGEPRHFISVVQDITERRRSEEALLASRGTAGVGGRARRSRVLPGGFRRRHRLPR